ncbi:hypothetical protein C8Q76DRAFT_104640 [Earliella scabrosa]|nr:hypothetical protein C8Q76DRAFT_104640 [Earliella scabrosa]
MIILNASRVPIDLCIDGLMQDNFSLILHMWSDLLFADFKARLQGSQAINHQARLQKSALTNELATSSLWHKSNAQHVRSFPKEVQEDFWEVQKA